MSLLPFPAAVLFLLQLFHYTAPQVVEIISPVDLTLGRTSESNSTCGLLAPEDFMSVLDRDGQLCYSEDPNLSHPASFLTDADSVVDVGSRTWWQSANGEEQVSLTLSFGGFFLVEGVLIDFRSPRPLVLVIEGSQDFGSTFHPLRYFSFDCEGDFGLKDTAFEGNVVRRDQLICTSNFTDGTKDNGSMVIYDPSSCSNCPDGDNFLITHTLTDLRVRLLRYSGLISRLGDPFLSSYYAIYNIDVPGSCVCNGQLRTPTIQDGNLSCPCSIPQELPFSCAPPTSGPLCRSCTPGFYRSAAEMGDECVPCDCDARWSAHETCDVVTGQCACHSGTTGRQCQSCDPGYIGPSPYLASPCTRCFCNGFPEGPCEAEEGWYQARAESGFTDEEDMAGYTAQGKITYNPDGYLEVSADDDSQQLIVSFPPSYLGDKRTSFSQSLTINFSLPELTDSSLSVEGYVEVVPFITSRSPADRLRAKLEVDAMTTGEQQAKVIFSQAYTAFSLLSYFSGRGPAKTAKDRDIHIALSNIVSLRLILQFPKELPSSAKILRLHYASLDYATRNSTHLATTPPVTVNYVERCKCPSSRTGSHCQSCSTSFTINPPDGGEFAHCVNCFCNFRSNKCDPVSGTCFNCLSNAMGTSCEDCVEGYDRELPYSFIPCNICASGYYDLGNSTCVACECNSEGSSSPDCARVTGQCACNPGVVGLKCDNCSSESTGSFPSCEVCDDCSERWLERILELENLTYVAVGIVSGLNVSEASVPELDSLFNLTAIIDEALRSNNVTSLFIKVDSLYRLVCELINRTEALIERAQLFNTRRSGLRNIAGRLLGNLANLSAMLSDLETEAAEISAFLSVVDLTSVDSSISSSLSLTNMALARVSTAINLIAVNYTSSLNELKEILAEYDRHYNYQTLRDANITSRLDEARDRLEEPEALLGDVDARVCGRERAENVSCDACGGVGCGTCGSGENCDGLASEAVESVNVSTTALDEAYDFLDGVQSDVARLENLEGVALNLVNDSADVVRDLDEMSDEAEAVLASVRSLLREMESELNGSRIDPDRIGSLVNASFMLRLDKDPDEFLSVLLEINSTIDMFFSMFMGNVTDTELRRKVNAAWANAQNALATIEQVAVNFTRLSTDYKKLRADFNASTDLHESLQESLSTSKESMNSAEVVLNETQFRIQSSQSSLSGLRFRVNMLETRVQNNLRELERARSLTSTATQVSQQVELDATATETQASELESDSQLKLKQSEEDLAMADHIRNRTCTLQTVAQNQLLTLEHLIRTEALLREEQLAIRSNIEGVANEIQLLEGRLQLHINRNTVCMDPTSVTRKRRRRRRSM